MKKHKRPVARTRNFSAWPKKDQRRATAVATPGGEMLPSDQNDSSDNISPRVAFLAYN